jgi:hypothetical protein
MILPAALQYSKWYNIEGAENIRGVGRKSCDANAYLCKSIDKLLAHMRSTVLHQSDDFFIRQLRALGQMREIREKYTLNVINEQFRVDVSLISPPQNYIRPNS